jgi:hypothetical protein
MRLNKKAIAALMALAIPTAALAGLPPPGGPMQPNKGPGGPMGPSKIHVLPCTAGSGDVSRALYVTNNTGATIAKNTLMSWSLKTGGPKPATGKEQLNQALPNGAKASLQGPPGSGGTCTASFVK